MYRSKAEQKYSSSAGVGQMSFFKKVLSQMSHYDLFDLFFFSLFIYLF